jgi:hypothetical protein
MRVTLTWTRVPAETLVEDGSEEWPHEYTMPIVSAEDASDMLSRAAVKERERSTRAAGSVEPMDVQPAGMSTDGAPQSPSKTFDTQQWPWSQNVPPRTSAQESLRSSNDLNFRDHLLSPPSTSMGRTMAAHMSIMKALMEQGDDVPGLARSVRSSSACTEPTIHTHMKNALMDQGDDMGSERPRFIDVPNNWFDPRTGTSHEYEHDYAPNSTQQQQPPENLLPLLNPRPSSPSPPSQNAVQRALEVAQHERRQSRNSVVPRAISPFRKHSLLRPPGIAGLPKNWVQQPASGPETTISPKASMLSYGEDDEYTNAGKSLR